MKSRLLIIVGIGITVSLYLISNHIVNYETWGGNENFFVKDYHGFTVMCDVNYFTEPTNCKTVDEKGIQVPNETLMLEEDECYRVENGNFLPCTMD